MNNITQEAVSDLLHDGTLQDIHCDKDLEHNENAKELRVSLSY